MEILIEHIKHSTLVFTFINYTHQLIMNFFLLLFIPSGVLSFNSFVHLCVCVLNSISSTGMCLLILLNKRSYRELLLHNPNGQSLEQCLLTFTDRDINTQNVNGFRHSFSLTCNYSKLHNVIADYQ